MSQKGSLRRFFVLHMRTMPGLTLTICPREKQNKEKLSLCTSILMSEPLGRVYMRSDPFGTDMDKPYVYTRSGRSALERFLYPAPNESTCESDPVRN